MDNMDKETKRLMQVRRNLVGKVCRELVEIGKRRRLK